MSKLCTERLFLSNMLQGLGPEVLKALSRHPRKVRMVGRLPFRAFCPDTPPPGALLCSALASGQG